MLSGCVTVTTAAVLDTVAGFVTELVVGVILVNEIVEGDSEDRFLVVDEIVVVSCLMGIFWIVVGVLSVDITIMVDDLKNICNEKNTNVN